MPTAQPPNRPKNLPPNNKTPPLKSRPFNPHPHNPKAIPSKSTLPT